MLTNLIDPEVITVTIQAAFAAALALGVVLICRRFSVDVLAETRISLHRGLVQMFIAGLFLAVLL